MICHQDGPEITTGFVMSPCCRRPRRCFDIVFMTAFPLYPPMILDGDPNMSVSTAFVSALGYSLTASVCRISSRRQGDSGANHLTTAFGVTRDPKHNGCTVIRYRKGSDSPSFTKLPLTVTNCINPRAWPLKQQHSEYSALGPSYTKFIDLDSVTFSSTYNGQASVRTLKYVHVTSSQADPRFSSPILRLRFNPPPGSQVHLGVES